MSKTEPVKTDNPKVKKTWKNKISEQKFIIISFLLPFLILGTTFAINGVYPFGTKQIMVTDFWQQYYPFFCDFQSKLQSGSSLLYSWSTGLGTNYVALMAYYLASPLNFLLFFVPAVFLREAVTVILLIKVGCAGMFFAIFLRSVYKRNDFSLVFFSLLYALCAFVMGYYWNIIWFDAFALLPLVVLGTIAVTVRGKYKMFVISLALTMLANYYMGFFSCIFTAVVFFGTCISVKMPWKAFFKKLGAIVGFSALALGISAMMVIPAYLALQHTHSAQNVFPDFTTLYDWKYKDVLTYLSDILGNTVSYTNPTDKEGLPNIFCGFICIILSVLFIRSKKIPFRDKLFNIIVLIFFLYCCMYKLPNFIIHGMHLPNMLPYRFAYLISFVLIVMAYRAFLVIGDISYVDIIAMAVTGGIFIVFAAVGPQTQTAVTASICILAGYLALFTMYKLNIFPQSLMIAGMFAIIMIEMCGGAYLGVQTVRTTDRTSYPDQSEAFEKLKTDINSNDSELFYRMENQHYYTINDPTIYGYYGASLFSSTVNESVTKYISGMGLIGWDSGNRYYYAETSPLTNAFLDIKYLIGRRTTAKDTDDWSALENYNYANSYKNNTYLSLGFMTKSSMKDFMYGFDKNGNITTNPFDTQNNLFTKATGINDDVFTMLAKPVESHTNVTMTQTGNYTGNYNVATGTSGTLSYTYTIPSDGTLYLYTDINNGDNITVTSSTGVTDTYEVKRAYIISAGKYTAGQTVTVTCALNANTTTGTAGIYAAMLNRSTYESGINQLKQGLYNITQFNTDSLSGTIDAKEDGMMYTSIANEKGWKAYVDGVETEITPIANAVVGVQLSAGAHTVTVKYTPEGFTPAVICTIVCIVIFAALIVLERMLRKKGRVLVAPCLPQFEREEVTFEQKQREAAEKAIKAANEKKAKNSPSSANKKKKR